MGYDEQLRQALQAVSNGASAMRHVALARKSMLAPDFLSRALAVPLTLLADLVLHEAELPALPQVERVVHTHVRRPRVKRAPQPRIVREGLPRPVDLKGLAKRLSTGLVDNRLDYPDPQLEASNCRALLLEVVRRAAFDWVLYRTSSKLVNRQLADSAYNWLFVETPNSPMGSLRERNEKELTSFLAVCAVLDLDPERVRDTARAMTERDIMGAGRPAERRKARGGEEGTNCEDLNVFDVDVDSLPIFDCMFAPEPIGG
jgi:hypothetical protein